MSYYTEDDQPMKAEFAKARPASGLGALLDQIGKSLTEADTITDALLEICTPVMDSTVTRTLDGSSEGDRKPELPLYLQHAYHLSARAEVLNARLRDIRDRMRL